jgi:hypothetical protein
MSHQMSDELNNYQQAHNGVQIDAAASVAAISNHNSLTASLLPSSIEHHQPQPPSTIPTTNIVNSVCTALQPEPHHSPHQPSQVHYRYQMNAGPISTSPEGPNNSSTPTLSVIPQQSFSSFSQTPNPTPSYYPVVPQRNQLDPSSSFAHGVHNNSATPVVSAFVPPMYPLTGSSSFNQSPNASKNTHTSISSSAVFVANQQQPISSSAVASSFSSSHLHLQPPYTVKSYSPSCNQRHPSPNNMVLTQQPQQPTHQPFNQIGGIGVSATNNIVNVQQQSGQQPYIIYQRQQQLPQQQQSHHGHMIGIISQGQHQDRPSSSEAAGVIQHQVSPQIAAVGAASVMSTLTQSNRVNVNVAHQQQPGIIYVQSPQQQQQQQQQQSPSVPPLTPVEPSPFMQPQPLLRASSPCLQAANNTNSCQLGYQKQYTHHQVGNTGVGSGCEVPYISSSWSQLSPYHHHSQHHQQQQQCQPNQDPAFQTRTSTPLIIRSPPILRMPPTAASVPDMTNSAQQLSPLPSDTLPIKFSNLVPKAKRKSTHVNTKTPPLHPDSVQSGAASFTSRVAPRSTTNDSDCSISTPKGADSKKRRHSLSALTALRENGHENTLNDIHQELKGNGTTTATNRKRGRSLGSLNAPSGTSTLPPLDPSSTASSTSLFKNKQESISKLRSYAMEILHSADLLEQSFPKGIPTITDPNSTATDSTPRNVNSNGGGGSFFWNAQKVEDILAQIEVVMRGLIGGYHDEMRKLGSASGFDAGEFVEVEGGVGEIVKIEQGEVDSGNGGGFNAFDFYIRRRRVSCLYF